MSTHGQANATPQLPAAQSLSFGDTHGQESVARRSFPVPVISQPPSLLLSKGLWGKRGGKNSVADIEVHPLHDDDLPSGSLRPLSTVLSSGDKHTPLSSTVSNLAGGTPPRPMDSTAHDIFQPHSLTSPRVDTPTVNDILRQPILTEGAPVTASRAVSPPRCTGSTLRDGKSGGRLPFDPRYPSIGARPRSSLEGWRDGSPHSSALGPSLLQAADQPFKTVDGRASSAGPSVSPPGRRYNALEHFPEINYGLSKSHKITMSSPTRCTSNPATGSFSAASFGCRGNTPSSTIRSVGPDVPRATSLREETQGMRQSPLVPPQSPQFSPQRPQSSFQDRRRARPEAQQKHCQRQDCRHCHPIRAYDSTPYESFPVQPMQVYVHERNAHRYRLWSEREMIKAQLARVETSLGSLALAEYGGEGQYSVEERFCGTVDSPMGHASRSSLDRPS